MDKNFYEALVECSRNSVDIFAYQCKVGDDFIDLYEEVEVIL